MKQRYSLLSKSIGIFICLFLMIHILKPNFIYDENDNFRQFGVGFTHTTVIPIWLVIIILAILSYCIALKI